MNAHLIISERRMNAELLKPDQPEPEPLNVESSCLPQQITVDNLPERIASLDKRSQLIVTALAAGMNQTDIATSCHCEPSAINHYIQRKGLRELVSMVTPQAVTAYRAARWAQIEQSAVTRAASKMHETTAMQAATIAAIASDKIERIKSMDQPQDSRSTGDILLSIKARLSR